MSSKKKASNKEVKKILMSQLHENPDKASNTCLDTDLVRKFSLEATDLMELIIELENVYQTSIPDDEVEKFKTPNQGGEKVASIRNLTDLVNTSLNGGTI